MSDRITTELTRLTNKLGHPPTTDQALEVLGGDRNKIHAAVKAHRLAYEAAERAAHQALLNNISTLLRQSAEQAAAITALQQTVATQQQELVESRTHQRTHQEQHLVTTQRLRREIVNLRLGLALLAEVVPPDRQHQAATWFSLLRSGEFTVVRNRVAEGDKAILTPLRSAPSVVVAIEQIVAREGGTGGGTEMVRQGPAAPAKAAGAPVQPASAAALSQVRTVLRPAAAGGR